MTLDIIAFVGLFLVNWLGNGGVARAHPRRSLSRAC